MNFQEALTQVRDTVCVSQRGNTCLGYGGMKCDTGCPAFVAGLERRRATHREYLKNIVSEQVVPGHAIIVRISRSSNKFLLEEGEYVYDGQDTPIFTCFKRYELPDYLMRAIASLPENALL